MSMNVRTGEIPVLMRYIRYVNSKKSVEIMTKYKYNR